MLGIIFFFQSFSLGDNSEPKKLLQASNTLVKDSTLNIMKTGQDRNNRFSKIKQRIYLSIMHWQIKMLYPVSPNHKLSFICNRRIIFSPQFHMKSNDSNITQGSGHFIDIWKNNLFTKESIKMDSYPNSSIKREFKMLSCINNFYIHILSTK